jgi:hypothetical protein
VGLRRRGLLKMAWRLRGRRAPARTVRSEGSTLSNRLLWLANAFFGEMEERTMRAVLSRLRVLLGRLNPLMSRENEFEQA